MRWAARASLGRLSDADAARLAAWRADPANAAAFSRVHMALDEVERAGASAGLAALREAATTSRRRSASLPAALMAASVGAGVLVSVAVFARAGANRSATLRSAPVQRYATALGRRATVRLEDGSIVELNTASRIEVAYTPGERDVRLLQGQALFRVAKNPRRPFVVTAHDRTVTALGTMFDVRIEPRRVSVVLLEGRVAVDPSTPRGLARLGLRLDRRMLTPGQALVSGEAGDTVGPADVAQATSWRMGRLIFRDEPLTEAAAEFNRYNPRKIVVTDPRAEGLKVSGVFDASQPDAFVSAATSLYPLEAGPPEGGDLRLRWRGPGQVVAPPDNRSSSDEERRRPGI